MTKQKPKREKYLLVNDRVKQQIVQVKEREKKQSLILGTVG